MNHSLEEIVDAEKQLQQAMVNNDVQALERLIHDDLVQGKPLEAFCRYLRVWLFQDERWQIISGTVRIIS